MRGKLRVMTMSLLSLTGLCTAMLFACAGGNAVQTFLNRTAAEAAQPADRPLTGMVIAIDAGHGGYDGGAVGRVSGIPEKGLNLDVAQKLRMLLENQGARVIMTRTATRSATRTRRFAKSSRICSVGRQSSRRAARRWCFQST